MPRTKAARSEAASVKKAPPTNSSDKNKDDQPTEKTTSKSRKRPRAPKKPPPLAATKTKIPSRIQRKIDRLVQEFLDDCHNKTTGQLIAQFQTCLESHLQLVHVDCSKVSDCLTVLSSDSSHQDKDDDDDNTSTKPKKRTAAKGEARSSSSQQPTQQANELQAFCRQAWVQQQLAQQVFVYLDQAGKGVLVWEDLQRVAPEFLFDASSNDPPKLGEKISAYQKRKKANHDLEEQQQEQLEEMMAWASRVLGRPMQAVDDLLLTCDDIIQLARTLDLQDV